MSARIKAALDQAIAAGSRLATTNVLMEPVEPFTAVQIPWAEWTALVTAIQEDDADA